VGFLGSKLMSEKPVLPAVNYHAPLEEWDGPWSLVSTHMSCHRYAVGALVKRMTSGPILKATSPLCKIVELLPERDSSPQYRIRCEGERFDRVERESNLTMNGSLPEL
jgi:hypothetical protein